MNLSVYPIENIFLKSCSYLVEAKDLWLIDCGDYKTVFEAINRIGKELKGVFLTHCHQDHVYGLCDVIKKYPNTLVFCSEITAIGLMDEEINLSYIISEYPFKFEFKDSVVVLNEGKYNLEGFEIEVIATPGHSDDCLSYIIANNIFTGDSYIPFAKVFTKWPRSNKILAFENEKKIINIINEKKLKVYSGHWK